MVSNKKTTKKAVKKETVKKPVKKTTVKVAKKEIDKSILSKEVSVLYAMAAGAIILFIGYLIIICAK